LRPFPRRQREDTHDTEAVARRPSDWVFTVTYNPLNSCNVQYYLLCPMDRRFVIIATPRIHLYYRRPLVASEKRRAGADGTREAEV
jgi:hypothetical protein